MSAAGFSELTQQRDFMLLWLARLFGTAGSQMLMVAIGWQMYDLTGSAWDLGLVGLYQFAPALAFTLVAGHVADRVHRGRIVAMCLLLQAVVAGVLVVAPVPVPGPARPARIGLISSLAELTSPASPRSTRAVSGAG